MAAISKRLGPLFNGMSKLQLTVFHVDRLCFRREVFVPRRVQSARSNLKVQCSTFSPEFPVLNIRELDTTTQNSREQSAFQGGCLNVDRRALHAVLEKCADFQETVFTEDEFSKLNYDSKWNNMDPSRSLSYPSPADIVNFIRFQTNLMGRDDFSEASRHLACCLPNCSYSELLDIIKALYYVNEQQGNFTIIWGIIDRELLLRFYQNDPSQESSNFYLKVVDMIYWLNLFPESSFVQAYLKRSLKRHNLVYPRGVQLLFYACCVPWEWRIQFQVKLFAHFLNDIKNSCPFDVFLVAAESFSVLQFLRHTISIKKSVMLPSNFHKFLLLKASENVNDDNALTVLTQLLYTCVSKVPNHDHFYELLYKISKRNESISFLVIFYISQAMAECGIHPNGFYELMESCLVIDSVHPRILCSSLLSLYGRFGPDCSSKLAAKVDCELKRRDICGFSETTVLKLFCVFCDCGISAFNLWELVMERQFISDMIGNKNNSHLLQLIADDCIEVYAPEYNGSRLSDLLRMQIYLERCGKHAYILYGYQGFVEFVQRKVDRHGYITHILPGLNIPGLKDIIICSDSDGKWFHPNIDRKVKPWHVKKVPSVKSNQHIFAVWACPHNWPPYFVMLKHQALRKLGYNSVMCDYETWNAPAEIRDGWIHDKLMTHVRGKQNFYQKNLDFKKTVFTNKIEER